MSGTHTTLLPERFWSKVEQDGPDNLESCWQWKAARTRAGYGVFRLDKLRYAHRLSWTSFHGPIPSGLQLDHRCRTRNCVNPFHLEPVTGTVNVARVYEPGVYLKDACINGHDLHGANLYTRPDTGGRDCRSCRNAAAQRSKARKRAA